jgi:hypothetical protein
MKDDFKHMIHMDNNEHIKIEFKDENDNKA